MIMELLGPSLSRIQKQQGGRLQIDTVIPILIQALHRLEFIHSFGIAHRDLKPQQFLIGSNNILYLVDYGLARKFSIDGSHIPYQNNCSRAGNSTYASLSNHLGIHQTRRDDIESLSYMAVALTCAENCPGSKQSSRIPPQNGITYTRSSLRFLSRNYARNAPRNS